LANVYNSFLPFASSYVFAYSQNTQITKTLGRGIRMIFLLISIFIGIGLFEVPKLVRNKHWRELVVFAVFLLLAFVMTLLETLGVKLPNPSKGQEFIMKDLLHLYYK
jgi:hypothetical protein